MVNLLVEDAGDEDQDEDDEDDACPCMYQVRRGTTNVVEVRAAALPAASRVDTTQYRAFRSRLAHVAPGLDRMAHVQRRTSGAIGALVSAQCFTRLGGLPGYPEGKDYG
jgi:hypothetical protein